VTRERVVQFQGWALHRLVAHAYENVPYYRRLFDRHGLRPDDIRGLEDLPKLPLTSKKELRELPVRDILSRGADGRRLYVVRTSGFSGEPFRFRRSLREHYVLHLFWHRAHSYIGLRMRDRRVSVVYSREHSLNGRKLRYKALLNVFGIFPHFLVDCCLPPREILQALRRLRPGFLQGYPGVLSRVAELLSPEDRRRVRPRGIRVGGEVITPLMRRQITEGFGARVYDLYGCHEMGLIAWECRETGELHTCDDSLIVEVLSDGHPAAPGEEGELVATNLHAFTMPFIRYKLGDIVIRGSERCACGLPFSTLRIVEGRHMDYLHLPGGRLVHAYAVAKPIVESWPWVRRYQLFQEREDRVFLHVVPQGRPLAEQVRQLQQAGASVLGPNVEFRVELMREISPGSSGKYRMIRRPPGSPGSPHAPNEGSSH